MNEPPGSLDVAIRFQVRQASHVIYIYIYIYMLRARVKRIWSFTFGQRRGQLVRVRRRAANLPVSKPCDPTASYSYDLDSILIHGHAGPYLSPRTKWPIQASTRRSCSGEDVQTCCAFRRLNQTVEADFPTVRQPQNRID
jgi:hypothetical protein